MHLCQEKLLSFGYDLLLVQYSFFLLFHREYHQYCVDLCLMTLQQVEVILRSQLLQFHHRILVSFISARKKQWRCVLFFEVLHKFPYQQ